MPTMIVLLLGIAALLTATVAAYYWYKASVINPQRYANPLPTLTEASDQYIALAFADLDAIRRVMDEASRLNKLAAIWTGVSAFLSGITTFLGALH